MSEPTGFRLQSSELIHTPGIMKYAENAFRAPGKRGRELAIRLLTDGYGLPRFIAWGLLDGCIPYTLEGDTIAFDVDLKPWKNHDATSTPEGD